MFSKHKRVGSKRNTKTCVKTSSMFEHFTTNSETLITQKLKQPITTAI